MGLGLWHPPEELPPPIDVCAFQFLFILTNDSFISACMYVCVRAPGPLELETAVSCHVGAGS